MELLTGDIRELTGAVKMLAKEHGNLDSLVNDIAEGTARLLRANRIPRTPHQRFGRQSNFAVEVRRMAIKQEIRDYFAKFGKEGGKARAKNMTAQQRADAARKAVEARWAKRRKSVDEITEKSKQLLDITVKRETAMLGQAKAHARRTKQKKRKSS